MPDGMLVRAARTCEFLLGALFLAAAALKLANITLFAGQILSYGVISNLTLVKMTVLAVVPLEAGLGMAMLAGLRLRGWIFYISLGMLAFFSALVWIAWPEECGCFGPIKMGPWETLGKNVVMAAMALLGVAALRKAGSDEPQFGVVGKSIAILVITGLTLYFTQDQVFHSEKYAPKKAEKQAQEIKKQINTDIITPESTPAATPAQEPVSTAPTPAAEEDEALPTAPTERIDYPADAEAVYANYVVTGLDGAELNLGAGQYLVALLNATCDHCKATVPAINLLAIRPDIPTVVGLVQEPEAGSLDAFMQETGGQFPTLSMGNDFEFLNLLKTAPPRFTLIKDGRPVVSWEGFPPTAEDLLAAAAK